MRTYSVLGKGLRPLACAALLAALGAAVWPQAGSFEVTLTGQSMIRSDFRVHAPNELGIISPLLKGDVIFTNFEATVVEPGQSLHDGRFLSPPEALDALKALGFNLLALSDNHSFDLKVSGVQNALREVKSRNIAHAGIGNDVKEAAAPGYLKTPKGTVALVAMASGLISEGASATANRPGVNELRIEAGGKPNESTAELPAQPGNEPNAEDKARILGSIREARQHADLVIVYEHNHVFFNRPFNALFNEELPERLAPADWLKRWTHEEIDAGADIIVMHGAPLIHGVEIYRNRPIFYDLGNFIFNVPPTDIQLDEPIIWESVVAQVQFQGKNLQSITFQPITMNKIGEGEPDLHDEHTNNLFLQTRGLPAPATGDKARYILQRLADLSRPFGTKVEVKGDSAEINLKGRS
ncbi:MAG TPA: CapA family protein [Candidatus Acidoferrales bacterium]|jgi:poly-gamma-glutamate synthesis protein (capsule biosynthesis protein)|nr:CapA family protein [Candidatus Acidoferrales bacterium]